MDFNIRRRNALLPALATAANRVWGAVGAMASVMRPRRGSIAPVGKFPARLHVATPSHVWYTPFARAIFGLPIAAYRCRAFAGSITRSETGSVPVNGSIPCSVCVHDLPPSVDFHTPVLPGNPLTASAPTAAYTGSASF